MAMIDLLIVLTRQHIRKMHYAWIMRNCDLVPALLLVDDVADDLGVATATGTDGLGECFAILQIGAFHAGIEGEKIEH